MTNSRSSKVRRYRNLAALLILLLPAGVTADEKQPEFKSPWHLLIEPKFMEPEIATSIEDAERTIIIPAQAKKYGPEYLSTEALQTAGISRTEFDEQALANATTMLDSLEPEYVRDSKEVIQFAVLEAESDYVASAVLSPEFGARFEPIFGPDILVAVPRREKVYIFPKLATEFPRFSEMVVLDYLNAVYPVSRELFEWKDGKLKAVGYFR